MKVFLPALLFALFMSSCMRKKRLDVELPIPAATTPFSCDSSFYFTRLFDELKGENVWSTASGDLLIPYGHQTNMVTRADTNGKMIWQKTLGKWNGDYLKFIQESKDKYYAQYSDDNDLVFAHVDDELNILKQVKIRWKGTRKLYNTEDGGKLIIKNPSYHNGAVSYLLKYIDKDLNEMWEYTEGDGSFTSSNFFAEHEGYFYFAGAHWGDNKEEPYLIKMNKSGQIIWAKQYSGFDSKYDPEDIHHIAFKDGIILARTSAIIPAEKSKIAYPILMEINPTNGYLLRYSLNEDKLVWPVEPQFKFPANGGYYVLGSIITTETGKDIIVQKLDTNDNLLWEKQFVASADQKPIGITDMPDGTIYILGDVFYYDGVKPESYKKKMLIKTDKDGNTCY